MSEKIPAPLVPNDECGRTYLRHMQTVFGEHGDCARTVAACILCLPMCDVPNFWDIPRPEEQDPALGFGPQIISWARQRKIFRMTVSEAYARNLCHAFAPDGMVVELIGDTDREGQHGVVGRWNGSGWTCVHDPFPGGKGLMNVRLVAFWIPPVQGRWFDKTPTNEEREGWRVRLDAAQDKSARLTAELGVRESHLKEARRDLADAREECGKLGTELEETQTDRDRIRYNYDGTLAELQSTRAERDRVTVQRDEAIRELDQTLAQLAVAKETLSRIQWSAPFDPVTQVLKQDAVDPVAALESTVRELTEARTEIARLKSATPAEPVTVKCTVDARDVAGMAADAAAELGAAQEEIARLTAQLEAHAMSVDAMRELAKAEVGARIVDLECELERTRHALEDLRRSYDSLRESDDANRDQRKAAEGELDAARKATAEAEAKLASAEENRTELTRQTVAHKSAAKRTQAELIEIHQRATEELLARVAKRTYDEWFAYSMRTQRESAEASDD